ncbi:MAG: MBL fold metallo-hydrolase [Candidatus Omnitrophica bacterium]|nr:MBL fold metallo-hydrolase [Candidatus Omnitrophota bacterium]
MILETIVVGPMQVNCYLVAEDRNQPAVLIDPGAESRKIKKTLDALALAVAYIINTHGHYDHIGADNDFDCPVYAHQDDVAMLQDPALNLSGLFAIPFKVTSKINAVTQGQNLCVGSLNFKVIHIPGHTPGGMCLLMEREEKTILFSGDSLFFMGIGRSDLPRGDGDLLVSSIRKKLLILPDDTLVLPGHGPASTIRQEKEHNEFLRYDA